MLSVCALPIPNHLHGQAFLGPEVTPPRDYVHAARDRHDSAYDRVRAVRDRRWKYLRNYYPQQPYVSWIPFRNIHPIMQEMLRLHVQGDLEEVPARFMADSRPTEELYDCEADPHEIENLAADPHHRATLERLRAECDRWLTEVGDMGDIPEAEMVATWYPGGIPEVAAPLFVPLTATDPGGTPVEGDVELDGPALLQLHSGVQGASLEFRTDDDPHWRLYHGPLRLAPGTEVTVHTRADRVGFTPSPEASVHFRIS
jgi:N-sulfoglucosamine sulfohydrolase